MGQTARWAKKSRQEGRSTYDKWATYHSRAAFAVGLPPGGVACGSCRPFPSGTPWGRGRWLLPALPSGTPWGRVIRGLSDPRRRAGLSEGRSVLTSACLAEPNPSPAARVAYSTPCRSICEKPKPAKVVGRRADPAPNSNGPGRQSSVEGGAVARDLTSSCRLVREDENGSDGAWSPQMVPPDYPRQDSSLDVHRTQGRLQVHDFALHFDDEKRTRGCVPGEHVD
jgi:hypothetical protein